MVSAIVLAAGLSKRMGEPNKLLLPYKNKALVAHVVESLLTGGLGEIIVVLGHEAEQVQHVLSGLGVTFVYNPAYSSGMTTSIQQGVKQATGSGYMICLSDMVLITGEEYAAMARSFERKLSTLPKCIYIPTCNAVKGNPVIFSSWYRELILQHQDPEGCKALVQANRQSVHLDETGSFHILSDVDLPEDYNKLLQ